ncbi:DedA family protein [Candidatus Uhrbacteria bacterium]|nr:DedA family protein [Candidatus Uhrbacteria bacterium]
MFTTLLDLFASIATSVIAATGHAGVFVLMLVESAGIPIPSEVIMPFAGFLTATSRLNFWLVVLTGTSGNLAGSWLAYYIGLKGGRPFIVRFGRYFFLSQHDLDRAESWFAKRGEITVLVGRLLPVIRTYISFPAGIAKMDFKKFSFYTLAGVFPWCLLFMWLGIKLQNNWVLIHTKLAALDKVILVLIIFVVGLYIWWRRRKTIKA